MDGHGRRGRAQLAAAARYMQQFQGRQRVKKRSYVKPSEHLQCTCYCMRESYCHRLRPHSSSRRAGASAADSCPREFSARKQGRRAKERRRAAGWKASASSSTPPPSGIRPSRETASAGAPGDPWTVVVAEVATAGRHLSRYLQGRRRSASESLWAAWFWLPRKWLLY